MAQVLLKGKPLNLEGELPQNGEKIPDFTLVAQDLSEFSLQSFNAKNGKLKVILSVPSLDTPVCALQTRVFSEKLSSKPDLALIVVSGDLPFAMKRFCAGEGLDNVFTGSQYRNMDFSKSYGVRIKDGALQGLCARAVFVADKEDILRYTELVPEISQEPDYEKALAAVAKLGPA